jgi:hypothetical protein
VFVQLVLPDLKPCSRCERQSDVPVVSHTESASADAATSVSAHEENVMLCL